jgi:hypothetical protein
MIGLLKIAGLSAVLSAGLVTAFEGSVAPAQTLAAGTKRLDRLTQGEGEPARARTGSDCAASQHRDSLRPASAGCAEQTWPYIAPVCVTSTRDTPPRAAARLITIEQRREDANTSVLVRMPPSLAQL